MIKNIILYNLRSAQNVGSVFRTADAVGIDKIFLIGTTPTPIDRFKRPQSQILKTALGAEKNIKWKYYKTLDQLYENEKLKIAAIEQTDDATPIDEVKNITDFDTVLFGNEVDGIPKEISDMCKSTIEVPMMGKKESLNISVCCGVVLYHFLFLEKKLVQ